MSHGLLWGWQQLMALSSPQRIIQTTAPTRPRRQQPRTPAPTPELNATQKWRAAFMGDRAFARARAAGKNETEAGHGSPSPCPSLGPSSMITNSIAQWQVFALLKWARALPEMSLLLCRLSLP